MTKLQAALKDSSAKKWQERKQYYRVGGAYKACHNCGEYDEEREVWTSGFQVFRSYHPEQVGWTHWCYECGAKDERCWPEPQARQAKVQQLDDLRRELNELRKMLGMEVI